MKIAEFIKGQILMPRLQRNGVLVVYDLERRYRQLCLGLPGDGRQVIDATENSIESRDSALKALMDLGATNTDTTGLIVYVPARTPNLG